MRPLAIAVLAVVLAAACTGDGGGAAPPSDPPGTTTATTIAAAGVTTRATTSATTSATTTGDTATTPPSTPDSTTTDPPPSTTATTPDTNEPPPSTSPPSDPPPPADADIEQIRQEVADALVASWEAFDDVVRDPANADATERLRSLSTEDEFRGIVDRFVVRYITLNLAERTSDILPSQIIPEPSTLELATDTRTASMDYCLISTNLLVQIQPDGSEELQDDTVGVVLGTDTFVLADGRWLDSGGTTNEILDGETVCPER